jgi:autotransporter-associated beta strand protein
MKIRKNQFLLFCSFAGILSSAHAAMIDKSDNADPLNLPSSWTGGTVPSAADIARWTGLGAANSSPLGADLAFGGVLIGNTGGNVAIQSGNTLTLGASGIDMSGASHDLSISSSLSLANGAQAWNVPTGRTMTLDTGSFSRSTGSILNLTGDGTFATSMTGMANLNGILGTWAVSGSGTSSRFATLTAGNITPYTAATPLSGTGAAFGGMPGGGDGSANFDVAGSGTFAAFGFARNINTIRYTGGGATQNSNFANADILTINGIMNAGTGTFTIGGTGNTLNILIGSQDNLVLSAMSGNITLQNIIKNGGANPAAVTIHGPNTVSFGGINTYSGGTFLSNGNLTLLAGATPGSGPVHISEGSTFTNGGNITSQNFTGGGNFITTASTTPTGDWSGFTGTYTHNSTTVSSVFNSATATSANAAYVLASTQGSLQGMIAAGNGDYTLAMGSLSGVADSMFRGGGFATGTTTLEVGNLNTDTTFAGIIRDGTAVSNPKIIALTKVGMGSLTLSGTNDYTGPTLVTAGTLLVNGALGNTPVSVTAGTLAGSGTIAGSVSVGFGGTLSPGTSLESLATGTLTMHSGAILEYEIIDNGINGADLLAVNGPLSLSNVTLSLDAASLTALAAGSWSFGDKITLLSYLDGGSGITAGFNGYLDDTSYFFGTNEWLFNYNDTTAGNNFESDVNADGQNHFVTMTLIPEPSAALLGALGILSLLRRRSTH